MSDSAQPFLAFVECAGCGELFPVRSKLALRRAKWCSGRCRKRQYQRPCATCGKPCGGSDKSTYCTECGGKHSGELSRARWAPRRALIEGWWAEGKTCRQICELLGVSYDKTRVATWRALGYDLPYRRSGNALANIRRGNVGKMERLRARRKAAA